MGKAALRRPPQKKKSSLACCFGEALTMKVNASTWTETWPASPFYSLGYCRPSHIVGGAENLGQFLRGDRGENSPIEVGHVSRVLDYLPLVVPLEWPAQNNFTAYRRGFPVGFNAHYAGSREQRYFIYNHLWFTVEYHQDNETGATTIVGFEVKPFSVRHEYIGIWSEKATPITCNPHAKRVVTSSTNPQEVEERKEVIFTYDVDFQESDVKWIPIPRWEPSCPMADDLIHRFSIATSGGLSSPSSSRLLPVRWLLASTE
ncbi:hypothetical protein ACJRO7_013427 [Eucalyptus globulus]|uniref:Transmembrane 9 superfamily member n=1 Tax=Eucalyptus globulus TaxID=34317 RepID=A0ABD3L7I7_EUCGL